MEISAGYGWDDIFIDNRDIMRFINDHWSVTADVLRSHGGFTMEKLDQIKEAINYGDALSFESYMNDYVSDSGIYGVYGVIAKIIEEESGVKIWYLETEGEDRNIKTIMFPYFRAPWEYKVAEKDIEEADLYEVFRHYMYELGAEDEEPGVIYMSL